MKQSTNTNTTNISNEDLSPRKDSMLTTIKPSKGEVYNNIESDYVFKKSGIASYFPNLGEPFVFFFLVQYLDLEQNDVWLSS